mgnify:CR=1 FL=1
MDRQELAIIESLKAANVLHQKGLTDQAIETLVNCIKISPYEKDIYYELVRIFIETKRFPDAWAVIGTMPDDVRSHLKGLECAGLVHEGMDNNDQADQFANRILAIDNNHSVALNLKGILAQKQGDNGVAEDYFLKAILADSGNGEAYINLGLLYWAKEGKKEHALGCIKQGFLLTPAVPDVSSIYYSASRSLGMFGPAETDFNEASKRYPYNKNLAFLCIDVLLQQSKFEEALRKIEDVLEMFGLDDNILNSALNIRRNIGPLRTDPSGTMPTLSLCMIVKNEEKYLLQCLKSVRDVVDEIIVVDTGSTDKTKAIAEIFGAKLYDFPWTGDFSAARNYSLKQATGRWILILDADEVVSPQDHPKIKAIICGNSSTACAYSIATRNYQSMVGTLGWVKNSGEYPEEAGTGWINSEKVRLFQRNNKVFFVYPVHELLEYSLKKEGIPVCSGNIIIHHYGMMDDEKKRQKGIDYYLLGKMKHENNPTNMKYTFELARQAYLLEKNEETVDLLNKLLSLGNMSLNPSCYVDICPLTNGAPLLEIYTMLAASYLKLYRFDDALKSVRIAIKYNKNIPAVVFLFAHCEIIAGSPDNALRELQKAFRISPNYPPILVMMAIAFYLKGHRDKADDYMLLLQHENDDMTYLFNDVTAELESYGKKDDACRIVLSIEKFFKAQGR